MRRIVLVIICIFGQLSVFAQKSKAPSPKEQSLLWRITSKDLKKPSYLFGTMHLICNADYLWTNNMQRTLDSSNAVCFEMDMDNPSLYMEVAQGMVNTNGKVLREYYTDAEFTIIEQFVTDSLHMDISIFNIMKPVALQMLLMTRTLPCAEPASYENNIMEIAKKAGKEITGLEKPSEQVDLFDNLPADTVARDIIKMIGDFSEQHKEYQTLITAYKTQDLPKLHKLIQASKDIDIGGFLDTRNEKWIPLMVEKMDHESIFFAVGAGHLSGRNGVINLLRKAGYTVAPVK